MFRATKQVEKGFQPEDSRQYQQGRLEHVPSISKYQPWSLPSVPEGETRAFGEPFQPLACRKPGCNSTGGFKNRKRVGQPKGSLKSATRAGGLERWKDSEHNFLSMVEGLIPEAKQKIGSRERTGQSAPMHLKRWPEDTRCRGWAFDSMPPMPYDHALAVRRSVGDATWFRHTQMWFQSSPLAAPSSFRHP